MTDDERHPPYEDDEEERGQWNAWTDEFNQSSAEDEYDADIAQHILQRHRNQLNEEVDDGTSDDEKSEDEEFEEAIRREEARMNGFVFHVHLA